MEIELRKPNNWAAQPSKIVGVIMTGYPTYANVRESLYILMLRQTAHVFLHLVLESLSLAHSPRNASS